MAAGLKAADGDHPIFEPLRPWLARLAGDWPAPEALSALAAECNVVNARGVPLRFAAPVTLAPANYESRIHDTGVVATRPHNLHDLLNALAWLAFPRTKAAINALHAEHLRREGVRRGRARDALTLFDEGGALVAVSDASLEALVVEHRWKELFWTRRARVLAGPTQPLLRFLDDAGAQWLAAHPDLTPPLMPPLPAFGYPGWLEGTGREAFYADERYFRPLRTAGERPRA